MKKKTEQVKVSTYLSQDLAERLKALSEQTRVPQAAYFREAIEDLLKKYEPSRQREGPVHRMFHSLQFQPSRYGHRVENEVPRLDRLGVEQALPYH